jgi:hypothetical protein
MSQTRFNFTAPHLKFRLNYATAGMATTPFVHISGAVRAKLPVQKNSNRNFPQRAFQNRQLTHLVDSPIAISFLYILQKALAAFSQAVRSVATVRKLPSKKHSRTDN